MKYTVWYGIVLLIAIILVGCNQETIKPSKPLALTSRNDYKGIQSVSKIEGEQKGRRIALVIGNARYKHASELRSPVNDATDISEALSNLSFDEVIDTYDASKGEMERSIDRFIGNLQQDDMAVFYYSGHGMEINGKNYFIPVEANLDLEITDAQKLEEDAKKKTVSTDRIVKGLNKAKSSFIIVDACRTNFLPTKSKDISKKSGVPVKAIGGGSTPIAKNANGDGDIITLYATKDGAPAFDGKGRNSLFTKHLLRGLKNTGLTVNQLVQQVTKGVKEESVKEYHEMQKPFVYGSLTEDRCLAANCQGQSTTTPPDEDRPTFLPTQRGNDPPPPPI